MDRCERVQQKIGSPDRTRTSDPMINSHLLYQLSYWGTLSQMQRNQPLTGVKGRLRVLGYKE